VLDAYERQPVSLPNGEDGFDAVFVTASGAERQVPWRCLPQVVDEIGGPVRSFRSFRGRRYPGWYWSATLGRRIDDITGHNDDYGFGRVNANEAVLLARKAHAAWLTPVLHIMMS
jgi:hypothetical protein